MRSRLSMGRLWMVCVVLALLVPCAPGAQPFQSETATPDTADRWRVTTPEAQGVDSDPLARLVQSIREAHLPIRALVVVRHEKLVAEAYFHPYQPHIPHHLHSAAKSIIGLLTGIAIDSGTIAGVHQPVAHFFPEFNSVFHNGPHKQKLTLQHLLEMRCGLRWDETSRPYGSSANSAFQLFHAKDKALFFLNLPVVEAPGVHFKYNSGASFMLAETLVRASGHSLPAYAERHLFGPMGITACRWDPQVPGSLSLTARDAARIGQLLLNRGRWKGRQIVSKSWLQETFRFRKTHVDGFGYGYQGWLRAAGTYMAAGYGGQRIFVVPRKDLVVVLFAALNPGQMQPHQMLDRFILPAVRSPVALADNPAAFQRLQSACRQARRGDPATVRTDLPGNVQFFNGRWVQLAPNAFGLHRARLVFQQPRTHATLELEGRGPRRRLAVGLDGTPRRTYLSPPGPLSGYYALAGRWQSDGALKITMASNDRAMRYDVRVRRLGGQVIIESKELIQGVQHSLFGQPHLADFKADSG